MGYVSDVAVSHFDPECRSLGTMPMAAMSVLISLSACHLKMTRMSCSSWWLCDSVCHCTIRSRAPHLIKREGSVTLLLGVQSWLFTYSCWSRVTLTSTIGTNSGLARSSAAPNPFFRVVYVRHTNHLLFLASQWEFLVWNFTVHCSFEKFLLQFQSDTGYISKALRPLLVNPTLLTFLAQPCAFPEEESRLRTNSFKTMRCEQGWLEIKQICNSPLVW